MRADQDFLDKLNELLGHELASSELYLAQSWILKDLGYEKLYARFRHESDDERAHAEKLMERILYLGGTIDVTQRPPLQIGAAPLEMFEKDLEYELDVARMLNELIAMSDRKLDAGTRLILDELLNDTEMDHILWLESQLRAIKDIGLPRFLAEQV